jgi:hypothetical protein
MRITVKGNAIGKLREFRNKLATVPSMVERAADNAAEEIVDLVAECFATQKSPYGEPWPDKVFDDGRAVLVGNTTRLRRGWHVKKLGRGKRRVMPNVDYAKYHQDGTGIYGPHKSPITPKLKRALAFRTTGGTKGPKAVFRSVKGVPPRKMIPDAARGLPPQWRAAIGAAVRDALKRHFK